jgi:hypothetical protein
VENEPREYICQVRAALKRTTTYMNMLQRENRCVRIRYANSCHVDVVPCTTLDDGTLVIMTFRENEFEETNPLGFTDWMRERDDLANGHLRPVIRLMKWLRDYKNTFDCPSVILSVLLGESVWTGGSDRYPDVPRALVAILEDLDEWLSSHDEMPLIHDPSCPGTNFNHRWEEAKYQTFKKKIHDYVGWARQALDLQETDGQAAILVWQKLFGPEFAADAVTAERASIVASRDCGPPVRSRRRPRRSRRRRGRSSSTTRRGSSAATTLASTRPSSALTTGHCARLASSGSGTSSDSGSAPMSRSHTRYGGRSATAGKRRSAPGSSAARSC